MRLVETETAPDGAWLAHDVFGGPSGNVPLLRAGVQLDARYRAAIASSGITRLVVEDEESEGIEVTLPLDTAVRAEASARLGELLGKARHAINRREPIPYEVIGTAESVAGIVLDEVLEREGPVGIVATSGAAAHGVRHPLDVAVLGLLIGRLLFSEHGRIVAGIRTTDRVDDALRRLSLGLVLHDVGHLEHQEDARIVDGEVVESPASELRRHVEAGHRALPHALMSAHAAAVVRDHHERWSGGGPGGLQRERIPQFARIAAVADVFVEATSDLPWRPGASPAAAVAAICRGAGRLFDPEVVDILRRVVAPYPVGTEVALSDGSRGLVSHVPADLPHRPTVRVLRDAHGKKVRGSEVALHREPELEILAA